MFCEIEVVKFALDLDVTKTRIVLLSKTVSGGFDRIASAKEAI